MQMAKTSQAIGRLHEEGILYIVVLTDPTYGGVSASFATLGDVLIAEPGSYIGFAGPKVIEQTIRQTLPDGFQTSEFLLDHGQLDLVEPRENLRGALRKLLDLHALAAGELTAAGLPQPNELDVPGQPPIVDPGELAGASGLGRSSSSRATSTARTRSSTSPPLRRVPGALRRPALRRGRGDRGRRRAARRDPGHGRRPPRRATRRGEMVERNFGMPNPEGYRKGLRLMRHAAKFGMPIVTLVDTPGAYPGLGAEERGQSIAIAQSIMEMSRLPRPDRHRRHRRGRQRRCARPGRRRPRADAGELVLLGDQPGGLLDDPLQGRRPGAAGGRGAAPDRAATCCASAIMDAVVPEPDGGAHTTPGRGGREPEGGRSSRTCRSCSAFRRRSCSSAATTASAPSAMPGRQVRPSSTRRREPMTEPKRWSARQGADPLGLGGGARPRQAARGHDRAAVRGRGRRVQDRDRARCARTGRGAGRAGAPPLRRRRAGRSERRSGRRRRPRARDRRAARRHVLPRLAAGRGAVRRGGRRRRRGPDGRRSSRR